jgi:hypothetical protein
MMVRTSGDGGYGGCQARVVLHEVVWGVVRSVADALEGPAGGGLAHGGVVAADEGASAVVVPGLVASVEEEG